MRSGDGNERGDESSFSLQFLPSGGLLEVGQNHFVNKLVIVSFDFHIVNVPSRYNQQNYSSTNGSSSEIF